MPIVNVTLEDILRARDTRANAQRRLLRAYRLPLVSFTMNIAGPVKSSPLIELAFDAGLEALYDALGQPAAAEVIRPATGCEALLVYDRPAAELKAACLTLETAAPIGRLYDLDVLDTDGSKLSRPEPRTCLICGGPVTVCSRSRAHGLDAIVGRTHEILADFAAGHLAGLAAKTLEQEVRLTPKPGLVDERNNGAHNDMDLPLFLRSIDALTPWFRRITALSLSGADAAALQAAGLEAEAAMFRATGGVNTHKGALFSFSVLLAALVLQIIAVWTFRYPLPPVPAAQEGESPKVLGLWALLKKYPAFPVMLMGCALLQGGHNACNTYMIHIVDKVGAGESLMGVVLAVSAFMELPAMTLFSRMRQKLSLRGMFLLCAAAFVAKDVLFLLARTPTLLYVSAALQFFEFGVFLPATVYYAAETLDAANQAKGQGLIHIFSNGVGPAVMTAVSGTLVDRVDVNAMLLFNAAAAVVGLLVVALATSGYFDKRGKEK